MSFRKFITQNIANLPGWHTNRKIVVIESDDWGSIRMPSKEVYKYLLGKGIRIDKCHYCKYDSLASEEDLTALFEVLTSFKDYHGNHPVITANAVVANPDFEKIQKNNFLAYHYQLFTDTLKEYPNHSKSFLLWQEGIYANVFRPQFHGREHLNISRWLTCLRNPSKETLMTFDKKMYGISADITKEKRKSYMAAFEFDTEEEKNAHPMIIHDGINLFKKIFNTNPTSFIAPNYQWHSSLETTLYDNGIKSIQGLYRHRDVAISKNKNMQKFRYIGQINKSKLCSLVRNAFFEPSEFVDQDWVNTCLRDIASAFRWEKPAIICSHRVNFIGFIDTSNRDKNLKLLKTLLYEIQKKWPDVEFMSSDKLTDLIIDEKG